MQQMEKHSKELGKLVVKLRDSMREMIDEDFGEEPVSELTSEQILAGQRLDLAWLLAHPDLVELHQGNYVGVWHETIVGIGPSPQLILAAAKCKRGVVVDEVLVVPVRVSGSDSEELWIEIQAMMEV